MTVSYFPITASKPPLDVELIVKCSDPTFRTARVVVFESGYSDDVQWHIDRLDKKINEWQFVHECDEYEYEAKLTARCV